MFTARLVSRRSTDRSTRKVRLEITRTVARFRHAVRVLVEAYFRYLQRHIIKSRQAQTGLDVRTYC